MSELVRVNDEVITTDDFIKILKLTGRFDTLMDEIVKEKLTVHAARLAGMEPEPAAIQERADQIRRIRGLHRAADMNNYLDMVGISLDEFEDFVVEHILYDDMNARVVNDEAVEEYFTLNSPRFDAIDISHIVVESEGMAREIIAVIEDEPDMFDELAREHSMADTAAGGGFIGRVHRGAMHPEIEAKVFQASEGEILGPFAVPGGSAFEVFRVNAKQPASLSVETADEIRRSIREEWLAARARESRIELC
ncbi:MAG: peptidylprolyl isomerase [Pseudomonadota bacterium]